MDVKVHIRHETEERTFQAAGTIANTFQRWGEFEDHIFFVTRDNVVETHPWAVCSVPAK